MDLEYINDIQSIIESELELIDACNTSYFIEEAYQEAAFDNIRQKAINVYMMIKNTLSKFILKVTGIEKKLKEKYNSLDEKQKNSRVLMKCYSVDELKRFLTNRQTAIEDIITIAVPRKSDIDNIDNYYERVKQVKEDINKYMTDYNQENETLTPTIAMDNLEVLKKDLDKEKQFIDKMISEAKKITETFKIVGNNASKLNKGIMLGCSLAKTVHQQFIKMYLSLIYTTNRVINEAKKDTSGKFSD